MTAARRAKRPSAKTAGTMEIKAYRWNIPCDEACHRCGREELSQSIHLCFYDSTLLPWKKGQAEPLIFEARLCLPCSRWLDNHIEIRITDQRMPCNRRRSA